MNQTLSLSEIVDEVISILEAHKKCDVFVPSFLSYDVYDAKYHKMYPTHHWSQLKEMKKHD